MKLILSLLQIGLVHFISLKKYRKIKYGFFSPKLTVLLVFWCFCDEPLWPFLSPGSRKKAKKQKSAKKKKADENGNGNKCDADNQDPDPWPDPADAAAMARPIDYSKWKDIEVGAKRRARPATTSSSPLPLFQISDDEDDTHPNIDTPSLFKWRHEARVKRMEELTEKKKETQREKEK